jgi:catechol 2,3-dioxygenase-like lactoylglutathione lyase family enzyme
MRLIWMALLIASFGVSAFGQFPEFYQKVDRMTWVVEDLEKTIGGWARLGFTDVVRHGRIDLPGVVFGGEPVTIQVEAATVLFGDVPVDWVRPIAGKSAYTEFLEQHGSGVFSLLHRAPSREAYSGEIERLEKLGVKVLQRGIIPADAGSIEYAYMDTGSEGKYVLGLMYVPEAIEDSPIALPSGLEPSRTISQYAFVVRDLEAVSSYWNRLGFPEMEVTHPALWDLRYHDQAADFDAKLGWQRHGKVVYEWILPLQGPTVYQDHLAKRGEGFHHLAFNVEDFDGAVREWTELGFPFVQGGAWGEKDKPGHGRFAYQDTDAIGGIDIELLWTFR